MKDNNNISIRIKATFGMVFAFVLMVVHSTSCRIDPAPSPYTGNEPANLTISMSVADIESAVEPMTKSPLAESGFLRLDNDTIYCVSVALVKVANSLADSRLIGFRNLAMPKKRQGADNQRFFYFNADNALNHEGQPLQNIPYTQSTHFYSDGADDTREASSDYGLNKIFSEQRRAYLTFDYDHPLHGNLERLTPGRYALCVFANHSEASALCFDHTVGFHIMSMVRYYEDHRDDPGFKGVPPFPETRPGYDAPFEGYMQAITGRFTLNDADVQYYWGENDYRVSPQTDAAGESIHNDEKDIITSASNIKQFGEILMVTWAKYINLVPGDNHIDVNLKRGVSRVTVHMNNQSTVPIKIKELGFCEHMGIGGGYLFPRDAQPTFTPQLFPESWKGRIDTESDRAIHPLDTSIIYNEVRNNIKLFDALILPNRDLNHPFEMTVEVEAVGQTAHQETVCDHLANSYVTKDVLAAELEDDDTWPENGERYFAIQTINNDNLFFQGKVNPNDYPMGDDQTNTINHAQERIVGDNNFSYLWVLKKVKVGGVNKVIIKNMKYNGWIKVNGNNKNGDKILFDDNENNASLFDITHHPSGDTRWTITPADVICFRSNYGGKDVYVNMKSNRQIITCSEWDDLGSHFKLYEATINTITIAPRKRVTFPMSYFEKGTGVAYPLDRIKRNEHVNIILNVRYNTNRQLLEFEVEPATVYNNEVIFD